MEKHRIDRRPIINKKCDFDRHRLSETPGRYGRNIYFQTEWRNPSPGWVFLHVLLITPTTPLIIIKLDSHQPITFVADTLLHEHELI